MTSVDSSAEVDERDEEDNGDPGEHAEGDGEVQRPEEGPRYLNRELSWLDFNCRVLAKAEETDTPLLERCKFLAIFSSNLDEFFQVRVAGLKSQLDAGLGAVSPDGLTPAEQLRAIRARVKGMVARQDEIFLDDVVPTLAEVGIALSDWESLDNDDRQYLDDVFERQIFPVLTPLAVDEGHPFPYISNMSLNLAVIVRDPKSAERRFARVKVPQLLPRFVVMPDGERFVPLEQVIAAHLGSLFSGMEIDTHVPFRVTRNADPALEEADEPDDLLAAVELELRRRRFGRAVRLEIDHCMPEEILDILLRQLDVDKDDVYVTRGPLELSGLWAVHDLDRPELKDEPWTGVAPPALVDHDGDPVDVLSVLRKRDVLVHHPYESFIPSVQEFIEQAAADPQVLAIKQTLYRTSDTSPVVRALIQAGERGKQVAVLVELKARFDEQANIAWARALEEAGVHVVYGLVGLKTHAKIALIVRAEDDGIRLYSHVGTGNYNPRTARLYEDMGLLSADHALGEDLIDLFNYLTGYSRQSRYRKLLVAPAGLRETMIDLIRHERDAPDGSGRILMKMNSLVDTAVIDALYEASQAGVRIDLIVRGICCLRPGVPALSENIRVRSLVGRFLEHSRIYAFRSRDKRNYYIGSADMMPRNLDRRVEAIIPVDDEELQDRLQEVLDVELADDELSWTLGADGTWSKVPTTEHVNAQARLGELAIERARRHRSELEARRDNMATVSRSNPS